MADDLTRNCPFCGKGNPSGASNCERCGKSLDGAEEVRMDHLSEAIQYRSVDREFWR